MARLNYLSLFFAACFLASCAGDSQTSVSLNKVIPNTPPPASWLQQIEQQAIDSGVSASVVHDALDNFVPNPRVVELDRKQPEVTITFADYRQNNVTSSRASHGGELLREYALQLKAIEARTGVAPQVIVALWGMESSFGRSPGNFEIVNSLATLAYEGRRADFFRAELINALRILEREHKAPSDLRGSWAGAMGQCQFMPSTYLKYAVDGDGDGKADIWNNSIDALASIANYLASIGWQNDKAWGFEVEAGPMPSSEVGLGQSRTLSEWTGKGVTLSNGGALPQGYWQASLLQPDGGDGSSFLVSDNVRALMRWNRSTYFAVSVGLLSDGIKRNSGS